MKEKTLRKLILLLLVAAIISVLWAIGSTSRKKVELKKSETLGSKLDKLILANTALVNDLKTAQNRLSKLQHSERLLKKSLEAETKKNQEMEQKIKKATSSALGKSKSIEDLANEAEVLKNTNIALGEEIISLKAKEAKLRLELETLRPKVKTQKREQNKNQQVKKQPEKSAAEQENNNKNFNWK